MLNIIFISLHEFCTILHDFAQNHFFTGIVRKKKKCTPFVRLLYDCIMCILDKYIHQSRAAHKCTYLSYSHTRVTLQKNKK